MRHQQLVVGKEEAKRTDKLDSSPLRSRRKATLATAPQPPEGTAALSPAPGWPPPSGELGGSVDFKLLPPPRLGGEAAVFAKGPAGNPLSGDGWEPSAADCDGGGGGGAAPACFCRTQGAPSLAPQKCHGAARGHGPSSSTVVRRRGNRAPLRSPSPCTNTLEGIATCAPFPPGKAHYSISGMLSPGSGGVLSKFFALAQREGAGALPLARGFVGPHGSGPEPISKGGTSRGAVRASLLRRSISDYQFAKAVQWRLNS